MRKTNLSINVHSLLGDLGVSQVLLQIPLVKFQLVAYLHGRNE